MIATSIRATVRVAILPLALVAACKSSRDAGSDTTSVRADSAAATTAPMPMDSNMAGMGHTMMNRSTPKDSNQAFLRMMSDHHQGMIQMADTAMGKLGAKAKADAQKLRTKQMAEQKRMVGMLGKQYQDAIMPMTMPSNQGMMDAVAKASSGDADRTFYQQVIAHHREGVQMSQKMLPHLTGETKQMATKSVEEQTKEIAEFEKKAGAIH